MAPSEEINIPQKPPMVMVDRVVQQSDKTTITAFLIREDNIFVENGEFREAGLMENMAQSAAASLGMKPGVQPGAAPIGFIGAVKNLKIHRLPAIGEEIITSVTVLYEVFQATIVQAGITLNKQEIASCELKIFLQPASSTNE
jgi:predicted hotdog family 3-hydroxylacyl-ACP dehydratase